MRAAVVTVVWNTDKFIRKQFELYSKHLGCNFIIVDNSTDTEVTVSLRQFALDNNIRFIRPNIDEGDYSRSHGKACNHAYYNLHKEYEILLFSDHDLFPIMDINIWELMKDKVIAGVPQIKWETIYLWAGLVVINNTLVDVNAVDFMPSPQEQLDTGGELNKIFKHLPEEKYHLFAERQEKDYSNIYYDINSPDIAFLHFRNGGNWKGMSVEEHDRRIERLMQML